MPRMGFDAQSGLPYIDDGSGHQRILGALKPTKLYSHFPHFSTEFPTIPESEWAEFEDDDSMLRILDQDGHGSCVGHGSDTAFEMAWWRRGGAMRHFSANYLYSLINGGSDNGAVVGDAADALQQKGVCLDETVPEGNVIFTRQMPAAAAPEAARFKAGKIYRITTWEEVVTAVLRREPISVGIDCGGAFTPGQDGFMPNQRGGGGGHCMCVRLGLRNKNGVWYVKTQNSWGQWGVKGCCWLNKTFFQGGMGDHFIISGPLEDPQDPGNLPKPG